MQSPFSFFSRGHARLSSSVALPIAAAGTVLVLTLAPNSAGATSNIDGVWDGIYYSDGSTPEVSGCNQCHTSVPALTSTYGEDFFERLGEINSTYSTSNPANCALVTINGVQTYDCITNDVPGAGDNDVRRAITDIEEPYRPNLVSIEITERPPGQSASTESFSPGQEPGTLPPYAETITLVFGDADRSANPGDTTIRAANACTSGDSCGDVDNTNLTLGSDGRTEAVAFVLPPLEERAEDRRAGEDYLASARARNLHFTGEGSASFTTENVGPTVESNCQGPVTRFLTADEAVPGATIEIDLGAECSPTDPDDENGDLAYDVPDAGDVTYGSVESAGDGVVNYTLPDELSEETEVVTFTLEIEDEDGADIEVDVVVNVPPGEPAELNLVANDDFFVIEEDGTLTGGDVAIVNSTTENEGAADEFDGAEREELSFVFGTPSSGELASNSDGTFDFTPDPDFFGDVTFTYTLTDDVSFDEATVTITVTPVNDLPTADPIVSSAFDIDDPFTVDLLVNTDPDLSISDPEGDPLTVSNVTIEVVPASIGADPAEAASVEGSIATITPTALERLDAEQLGQIIVSYDISDGEGNEPVPNTLTVNVTGTSNATIRQPGAYADTLASRYSTGRYGEHFGGQNEANSSCHNCHTPGQVDVIAPECGSGVFNAFGDALCLLRDPDEPPLSDLVRRLAAAEPDFAPRMNRPEPVRITQGAGGGSAVGAPVTVADPGQTVLGETSSIVDYLIGVDGGEPVESDGDFSIDDNGQVRVARDDLEPGTYELTVIPVNDAGQQDNAGGALPGLPGFFQTETTADNIFVISVEAEQPVAEADSGTVLAGESVVVDVLANDTNGGVADLVTIDTAPTLGTATVGSDNRITYVAGTEPGTDTFTYTATNASGTSEPATVTIEVLPTDALVAVDDSDQVIAGQSVTVDVLANDRNAVRDGPAATEVEIIDAPDVTLGTANVSGQDIEFVSAAGVAATAVITYLATADDGSTSTANVSIEIVPFGAGLLADAVSDPELRDVAQAVDDSCALLGPSGSLSEEAENLRGHCVTLTAAAANGEQLDRAMAAIRNEEHLAVVDATTQAARGLGSAISNRLQQVRLGGGRGVDLGGVNVRLGDETLPNDLVQRLAAAFSGVNELSPTVSTSGPDPEWGLFIAGDISYADTDGSDRQEDFELEVGNLTIGADYAYDAFTTFGFAVGYSKGETEFGDGSSLDSEGFQATLYGVRYSTAIQGLAYEGYASFGRMQFDSTRKIAYDLSTTSVDTEATAEFDGSYFNLAPRVSYSRQVARGDNNGLQPVVTWSGGLDYLWLETEDYTESGGDGLALNVESEIYRSLLADVSVDFRSPLVVRRDLVAELVGGLSIGAELLDEDRSVTSSLAAAGAGAPRFTTTEDGRKGFRGDAEIGLVTSSRAGNFDVRYAYGTDETGFRNRRLSFQFSRSVFGNDALNVGVSRQFDNTDDLPVNVDYRLRF